MHNPAWHEQVQKRERLDRISHHFLSDTQLGNHRADTLRPKLLPLLCCAGDQAKQLPLLQQVLQRHGQETRILAADQVEWPTGGPAPPMEPINPARPRYRLHLVLLTETQARPPALALVVPARAQGLAEAYARLQEYAYSREVPRIGVIFTDSAGPRSGWCYFRKLAMMSRRTLRLPLVNLGYLPAAAPAKTQAALMVANRILHNQFFLPYRAMDLGAVPRIAHGTIPSFPPAQE